MWGGYTSHSRSLSDFLLASFSVWDGLDLFAFSSFFVLCFVLCSAFGLMWVCCGWVDSLKTKVFGDRVISLSRVLLLLTILVLPV